MTEEQKLANHFFLFDGKSGVRGVMAIHCRHQPLYHHHRLYHELKCKKTNWNNDWKIACLGIAGNFSRITNEQVDKGINFFFLRRHLVFRFIVVRGYWTGVDAFWLFYVAKSITYHGSAHDHFRYFIFFYVMVKYRNIPRVCLWPFWHDFAWLFEKSSSLRTTTRVAFSITWKAHHITGPSQLARETVLWPANFFFWLHIYGLCCSLCHLWKFPALNMYVLKHS